MKGRRFCFFFNMRHKRKSSALERSGYRRVINLLLRGLRKIYGNFFPETRPCIFREAISRLTDSSRKQGPVYSRKQSVG